MFELVFSLNEGKKRAASAADNAANDSLNEYEAMLLLLEFIQPPDTDPYPAADFLFSRYGNIMSAVNAGAAAFEGFEGADSTVIARFAAVRALFTYLESKIYAPPFDISDRRRMIHCVGAVFMADDRECVCLMPMKGDTVIGCEKAYIGKFGSVLTSIGHFAELMEQYPGCSGFAIAHHHIGELSMPSVQDMNVTLRIAAEMAELGYELRGHYIFGIDGVSSVPISTPEQQFFQ